MIGPRTSPTSSKRSKISTSSVPPQQRLADDFTLDTPQGGRFRLSEQRGKVVFINFWATWCPPCREEMPAMERLYTRYKKDGLVMLAVSVDGDPRAVTPFIEAHQFTFTVGLDPGMELANAYSVRGLPASFVVDRGGYLTALALGPRRWDDAAGRALVEGLTRWRSGPSSSSSSATVRSFPSSSALRGRCS